ncbi:MAG: 50S ribosomal protein L25/general stress protein Ctc [Holosporales bacterium]|jgi:large subunit ribosomal protein L25|nr:50S ribosomal protein L25/general stress protein Ctc [Holosporales bacterium]
MASSLRIVARNASGKREARKLRHSGFVPGVIYGGGSDPELVAIGAKELRLECGSRAFLGHVIDVDLNSKHEQFLPKEVVLHPVTGEPVHVDFQRISKDSTVRVGIVIEFINELKSPGLKRGGVINVVVHNLECICSPVSIPASIIIDVTGKEIGDSLLLADIKLPDGVTAAHPERDAIIATIVGARVGPADDSGSADGASEEAEAAAG